MLDVVLIPLILFLYTFPLGYLILKQFREKTNILLSSIFGLAFFILLLYWIMLIKFNFLFISIVVIFMDIILLIRTKIAKPKIRFNRYLILFFLLLFLYYAAVPLFVQFSYYRDYDLIALGIQENSALELPWYNIKTYYPPGGSLLTAFMNLILPYSINKIMLNLSYFFMFLLFGILFQLGKEMKNNLLGFFICIGFLLTASSKNFIWGGATYPGITSMLFALTAFVFITSSIKNTTKKDYFIIGILLAASALTHIDALLTVLWGILACLFVFRSKKTLFFVLGFGIISLLLISPFILNSLHGKAEMSRFWSGENWEKYANGEIHPKALGELVFYNGWPIFIFALIGFTYLIWQKKFLFPLWLIFLFLSNSIIFLKIAKPLVLFYAINIIMWFGLSIPLAITGGYGLYFLYSKIPYKKLFLLLVLVLTLTVVVDYETSNFLDVYKRWDAGNLLWAFDNELHYLNKGDFDMVEWAKSNADGLILNPDSFAGQAFPVLSKKQTMQYFYHIFYDDLDKQSFMEKRTADAKAILSDANPLLIDEYDIKFIYLPSSIDANYEYNPAILEKYSIIKRSYGAKLLSTEKRQTKLKHYEAESYQTNGQLLDVEEVGMTMKAIALPPQTGIRFQINDKFHSDKLLVYIKHTSYHKDFPFAVRIDNFIKEIRKTASKPTFVESIIEIDRKLLEQNNGILDIVSQAPVYDIFLKKYFLIIDWIEIEEI